MTGVRWASFDSLDGHTLYAILRLRAEVFVVEQDCAYLDVDGCDTDPTTRHVWIEGDGSPVIAYLRLLADADTDTDAHRIGRVVTAATHRGNGLAGRLVTAALDATTGTVVLDAQSRLVPWYASYGFQVTGPEYLDDGLPHVPMRLARTLT